MALSILLLDTAYMKMKEGKKERKQEPKVNDASSSSLIPPRPSFFLVHHLESLEVLKHPYFTEFDESVTDGRTNGSTNGRI